MGKSIGSVPDNSIVLFPYQATSLSCGLAGIVGFKKDSAPVKLVDLAEISAIIRYH